MEKNPSYLVFDPCFDRKRMEKTIMLGGSKTKREVKTVLAVGLVVRAEKIY